MEERLWVVVGVLWDCGWDCEDEEGAARRQW